MINTVVTSVIVILATAAVLTIMIVTNRLLHPKPVRKRIRKKELRRITRENLDFQGWESELSGWDTDDSKLVADLLAELSRKEKHDD